MLIPAKSYKGAYRCGCASHVIGPPAVIGLGLAGSLLVRSYGWPRVGALAWLCARSAVRSFACPFVSADALLFARLRGRRPPAASQLEILWFWAFLFFHVSQSFINGHPALLGFSYTHKKPSDADRLPDACEFFQWASHTVGLPISTQYGLWLGLASIHLNKDFTLGLSLPAASLVYT